MDIPTLYQIRLCIIITIGILVCWNIYILNDASVNIQLLYKQWRWGCLARSLFFSVTSEAINLSFAPLESPSSIFTWYVLQICHSLWKTQKFAVLNYLMFYSNSSWQEQVVWVLMTAKCYNCDIQHVTMLTYVLPERTITCSRLTSTV